jgi:hypothetical protein
MYTTGAADKQGVITHLQSVVLVGLDQGTRELPVDRHHLCVG